MQLDQIKLFRDQPAKYLSFVRYVYLPYEFICTVQLEHDKAHTIFVWTLCFVGPLIVTVACYSSVMKVARQQARVTPLTTVGRLSKGGHDPDVGEMVVADGKSEAAVEENLAFTANDDKNSEAILLVMRKASRATWKIRDQKMIFISHQIRIWALAWKSSPLPVWGARVCY